MSISLRGEALGKEAGDEQRHVPEALQRAIAQAHRGGFQRIAQHEGEGLEARALGRGFVERLGAGKQRQQIHDVLLGLLLDRHVLFLQCAVHGVLEELAQIGHR